MYHACIETGHQNKKEIFLLLSFLEDAPQEGADAVRQDGKSFPPYDR